MRKDDIKALITYIESQFQEISELYDTSLLKMEIDYNLKIKVKNYLENTRSILDYCAHDIAESVGLPMIKISFPIIEKDINSFDGSIGRNLPGLKHKNRQIYDYLENIQPYHQNYSWLADFTTVTNDTKHSQLIPQIRNETREFNIKKDGSGMMFSGCKFKGDVRIGVGGAIVQIDPVTQFPYDTPGVDIEKIIWVDFRFNNTISALSLLKNIHDNLPKIIYEINKML